MHDLDKDGAWAIFSAIPVASLGFMIAACFDGTAGVNQYGPDPKGRGNSLPGGPGDNGAQDTPGTGRGQRRETATKPHLRGDVFDAFPYAASRLLLAVRQGYNLPQYRLSDNYYSDKGVPNNYDAAAGWLRTAAEGGDAEAQASLGLLYFYGLGVPQDNAAAFKWICRSIERGHTDSHAQFALGTMYHLGQGVTQDYAEAEKWFLLAAEQGHAEAQVRLNEMYAPGEGIEQDHVDPKPIEGGGSGLQSKSPDIHASKAVDDDLKIYLKELKSLHEEGMIDDDEYK